MLFISNYPDQKTIKDGMLQRVKAIDSKFEEKRIYLDISLRKNIAKKHIDIKSGCRVIKCNLFLHFFTIRKYIRQSTRIYIHSVYNSAYILLFRGSLSGKKIILDVHGAVPEELVMMGKRMKSKLYGLVEKATLRLANTVVVVTEQMKTHLIKKYQLHSTPKFFLYPILPENIMNYSPSVENSTYNSGEVVFVYSGNTQKWQNIELMMNIVKQNVRPGFLFYILCGDKEGMTNYLRKYDLTKQDNIILKSVDPSELMEYYRMAHYGFILRDNDIVNQVACPTKLVEYMQYGIIPIVKSDELGDFKEYGYEYRHYSDINKDIKPAKSDKNRGIVKDMLLQSKTVSIKDI